MRNTALQTTSFLCTAILLCAAFPTPAQGQCEVAQIVSPNGDIGNSFMTASVGSDLLVVGDPKAFGSLGAAFVFRRGPDGPGDWNIEATLMAPEPDSEDAFGGTVAVSGNVIVVTARHTNAPEFHSGAAYVYRFEPKIGNWEFESMLLPSDGAFNDLFGWFVSLDSDAALIGARNKDNNGVSNAGAAYIFRYNPDTFAWIEEAKLTDPNAEQGDLLGISVSISGDVALVGAPVNEDAGSNTGAAFIFRHDADNPGKWILEQQLQAFDAPGLANFGHSVSLQGDVALIGAQNVDSQNGAAYVMRFNGKEWVHEAKLVASNPVGPFPLMGSSVSISPDGTTALAGAPLDAETGSQAGAAHLFRTDGEIWYEVAKLTASKPVSGAAFGTGVDLLNDIAFVGVPHGSASGEVCVFAGISNIDCNENGESDACDIFDDRSIDLNNNGIPDECDADLDGNGTVNTSDLLILFSNWGVCDKCEIPGDCSADLDGNCSVNTTDLLILFSNWG